MCLSTFLKVIPRLIAIDNNMQVISKQLENSVVSLLEDRCQVVSLSSATCQLRDVDLIMKRFRRICHLSPQPLPDPYHFGRRVVSSSNFEESCVGL